MLIEDVPSVREKLASLVELGLTLAIDDFGAGTSNLSYLRDLPMTVLKIDRAFVRELADNQRDQIIVRSILSLAHALGYRVIAEGVETAQALELLKSWGCDEAQGFFICKPIPLAELLPWLEAQKAAQS